MVTRVGHKGQEYGNQQNHVLSPSSSSKKTYSSNGGSVVYYVYAPHIPGTLHIRACVRKHKNLKSMWNKHKTHSTEENSDEGCTMQKIMGTRRSLSITIKDTSTIILSLHIHAAKSFIHNCASIFVSIAKGTSCFYDFRIVHP